MFGGIHLGGFIRRLRAATMPPSGDEDDFEEVQFWHEAGNKQDVGEEDDSSEGPLLKVLRPHIIGLLHSQPDFKANITGSPSIWLDVQDPLLQGGFM